MELLIADFAEAPDSSPSWLVVTGFIENLSPEALFGYFTDAALIAEWWSDEAEVEPRVGGRLIARWLGPGWAMRGTYTEVSAPERIGFSWRWGHEPDTPTRHVTVELTDRDGGTQLTVRHGEYAPGDEDERRGHLEGWTHFLPRIGAHATRRHVE